MPHKADRTFFDYKRPWSKRKDAILAYYLEPYLAKVARIGRPILLIDGFAGPGKFADGEIGSPLIMCSKALAAINRGCDVRVLAIERDPELFEALEKNMEQFGFAQAASGCFLDHLSSIEQAARTHTIFLYLDPWTVDGLNWEGLDLILRHVALSGASVELLLNFNSPSFVRRGRALLKLDAPQSDPCSADDEQLDAGFARPPSLERLDAIVGGDWWQDIMRESITFPQRVERVVTNLTENLKRHCPEIGYVAISARESHAVPKYYLVFASRRADGLVLMNDAMAKTRGESLLHSRLFSEQELDELILEFSTGPVPRGELITNVIRNAFCRFTWAEIRSRVEALLKADVLKSQTGKVKINNSIQVWRARR